MNAFRPLSLWPGALLAPLFAPIPTMILALVVLGIDPTLDSLFELLRLVAPVAIIASYIGVLLIGLPAAWMLQSLGRLCIVNLMVAAAFSGPLLMVFLFPTGWSFAQSRLAWAWVAIVSAVALVVAIVFGVVNRLSWRVLPNAQIFEPNDR